MPLIKLRLDNLSAIQDQFRDIAANQIPFATALALTRTAQLAQSVVQNFVLAERFVLRQAAFVKLGVRVTPATKTTLASSVQDVDWFMFLQEQGGQKLPYGSMICVPIIGGARASVTALIPPDKTPHAVMASGRGFIQGNVMYLRGIHYKRQRSFLKPIGPGAATVGIARDRITPMYVLVPHATVPARFGFEQSVRKTVAESFLGQFELAMIQAVRTASR